MKFVETDIKEVKEQLLWNKSHGHKSVFLLGSGMSVTAGIPDSEGIISHIRTSFSSLCARTHPVTYEDHLSVLTPSQRQELIQGYTSKSRVNGAHLYLAAMVKAGYADALFTTNFDTLIQRSLTLENVFPGIVDFTAPMPEGGPDISGVNVIHLHGRKDGALRIQNEEEFDSYQQKMQRCFSAYFEKHTVLVVGYSGADDPVMAYLSGVKSFENRLYWIGNGDGEPEDHVHSGILNKTSKQACYVKGYDADGFFMELSRLLQIPAPRILKDPLQLVDEVLGNLSSIIEPPVKSIEEIPEPVLPIAPLEVRITPPEIIIEPELEDAVQPVVSQETIIPDAEEGEKTDNDSIIAFAKSSWSGSNWENYEALKNQVNALENEEARKYFAFFLFNWGAELEKEADGLPASGAEEKYLEAIFKYEEAIGAKPDLSEAYNRWGVCLRNMAKGHEGEEADKLYSEAFQKFEEAILLDADEYEAYNNWAIGLAKMAETKNEVEAQRLYFQAFEKYKIVLKNKPDMPEVYNNWGVCLRNLATMKRDEEAELFIKEAFQKFGQAIKLDPAFEMAYINWGLSLRMLAMHKRSSEAVMLYEEACGKYEEALAQNPDSTAALLNWALDLGHLAMLKGIEEAQKLLRRAFEKYEEATKRDSSSFEAYNNWAIALWNFGNLKSGKEADSIYKKAFEKFDAGLKINPDSAEILTNKAVCMSKVASMADISKSTNLYNTAQDNFKKALALKPKLFEAYYYWGIALRNQAEATQSSRTEDIYIQSLKQFEKAMKTRPEKHKIHTEWDSGITNISDYVFEEEPEKLYQETFKKYQSAIFTERNSLELYNNYDVNLTMAVTEDGEDYEKLYAEVVSK